MSSTLSSSSARKSNGNSTITGGGGGKTERNKPFGTEITAAKFFYLDKFVLLVSLYELLSYLHSYFLLLSAANNIDFIAKPLMI
jgi:hypothetical protein